MNQEELATMVAQILHQMGQEPPVKGSDYHPTTPGPQSADSHYRDGDFVEDITKLDLRKLYLEESPQNKEGFLALKAKTPARLGSGRAGARYKTLTMLRFRADHAAAQDSVFSQVPEEFAQRNGMIPVQTKCRDKEEYLTRPDLGRGFDEENARIIREANPGRPRVLVVVGDGLSSAAIVANAVPCLKAIQEGLRQRGIPMGQTMFVRYCRVGAGDAIGDITGCELVCVLVGERPGLVTDKSMSAYITYAPRRGIPESSRTVVSNIHAQGTTAEAAGAQIAGLMERMLREKASGVALQMKRG